MSNLKHINAIRRALWNGRVFGRAAVMVGAGFSRNADPATFKSRAMPLWGDLSKRIVEHLYPETGGKTEHDIAIQQSKSTSGGLKLGDEYVAAFGRTQLEELLISSVPDNEHRPGIIHKLLLTLPWADIFTTNYDTLLERAQADVVNRRYEVVRIVDEIPLAMRPRIVKLHGSLPNTFPLIVTEEDFRTYPHRFAPFVNLAQQAIMENVFCLIGFSGDDPNFIYWTGWVRDHLRIFAPRIYLCGIFTTNDSQRRYLDQRNVTIIDLSSYFPSEKYPDEFKRHRLATEWFLLNLLIAKPLDPLLWPEPDDSIGHINPDLPDLLPIPTDDIGVEQHTPHE